MFEQSELLTFWSAVVDPHGRGMAESIAADIASYTRESIEVVLDKMNRGKDEFKQLWNASSIDTRSEASIAKFYDGQFVEAYELANWHSGQENGVPPLNYARAAFVAKTEGLVRALDFGSGIGTGALCLSAVGCEVECADVATDLLRFVDHRLSERAVHARIIKLSVGERPRQHYYDLITCFDVLEHVPDQLAKLMELQSYLRPGGYLLVNLLKDSSDPDRPMHVSSAGERLELVRATALQPQWRYYDGDMQVLRWTRTGGVRNYFAAWVDRLQQRRTADQVS